MERKKYGFQSFFLLFALLATGLFHEFLSCAAAAVLCVYLILSARKNKGISFRLNVSSVSVMLIPLFYLLSAFWAVDSGMAFIGFMKFLPLPLFMLAAMQREDSKDECLEMLPFAAALITVVSSVLSFIPALRNIFFPADRLAGTFGYSNTYALFMLAALMVTVTREKLRVKDYIYILIHISGIILSGSRAVFALTVVSAAAMLFFGKNKRVKLIFLVFVAAAVLLAVIYTAVTDNFDNIGRFLTTSLNDSTFLGRILYWYDAFPIILKNPFGTGYHGYFYLQSGIQTGVYSVRFVHNDFLQLMLDIGWLPALLLAFAIVRSFFHKNAGMRKRLLIFIISAHCMFDFDLQYVAIFMVFILLLDTETGKERTVSPVYFTAASFCAACLSVYMFIPLAAEYLGLHGLSRSMYPWNTETDIAILCGDTDAESMERDADHILARNQYVTVAYSAKAEVAFSRLDFASMMEYKDKALKNSPFDYEEYKDYIYKLMTGYELYSEAGDTYSADYCRSKAKVVVKDFRKLKSRRSYFGKRIVTQPATWLPDDIVEFTEAE